VITLGDRPSKVLLLLAGIRFLIESLGKLIKVDSSTWFMEVVSVNEQGRADDIFLHERVRRGKISCEFIGPDWRTHMPIIVLVGIVLFFLANGVEPELRVCTQN
jgi:hypothetical protein